MARNIFSLSFVLSPQKTNIKETALKLISLLVILGKEDRVFTKFKASELHFKSVSFDLIEGEFNSNVIKLAETFLKFNLTDIRQYEKEVSPTIEFSRDFGFRFLLEFDELKNKHFSITGNISSSRFSDITIEHFPFENNDYDFKWYLNILSKVNDFFKPKYSGVNIILPQFIEMYLPLNVIYPLGWITYFSNYSAISMPENAGFEIIQEEKGQYVISTREDFTASKDDFFAIKDKLLEGMKQLKRTCKEYTEIPSPPATLDL